MFVATITRKAWMGNYLYAVAILHTIVAVIYFHQALLSMLQAGLFNTVRQDPVAGRAAWFLLFGALMALLALTIKALEQQQALPARSLGIGILLLAVLGVVLMPKSGFWFAFPPGLVLIWRKERRRSVKSSSGYL